MMNMNHHSVSVSFGSNLDSSLKPFIKSWEVGKASSSLFGIILLVSHKIFQNS